VIRRVNVVLSEAKHYSICLGRNREIPLLLTASIRKSPFRESRRNRERRSSRREPLPAVSLQTATRTAAAVRGSQVMRITWLLV